jgi:hypothetical protein
VAEALCYKRDLPNAQVHILDGGHMALETNFNEVLELIRDFMSRSKKSISPTLQKNEIAGPVLKH